MNIIEEDNFEFRPEKNAYSTDLGPLRQEISSVQGFERQDYVFDSTLRKSDNTTQKSSDPESNVVKKVGTVFKAVSNSTDNQANNSMSNSLYLKFTHTSQSNRLDCLPNPGNDRSKPAITQSGADTPKIETMTKSQLAEVNETFVMLKEALQRVKNAKR